MLSSALRAQSSDAGGPLSVSILYAFLYFDWLFCLLRCDLRIFAQRSGQ